MSNPEFCVLKADGINCEVETAHALTVAGADPEVVHINQLRSGERQLGDYKGLVLSGGFSYGDDVASGKVLATEMNAYLSDELQDFVRKEKPILGICNGFQVLVRSGLLPNNTPGSQQITLTGNEVGRFDCRWIDLSVGQSACKFVSPEDFEEPLLVPMQTAHAEGRFYADEDSIQQLNENGQVVFRYASPDGSDPVTYPDNPNGSVDNIAGICDRSGVVLGMMPHPERSVAAFHPHRVRTEMARTAANTIFTNIVTYTKEM